MSTPAAADALRPRRSVLYMPGANERALEKAKGLAADALILDLEDAVSPDAKPEARDRVCAAVRSGEYGHRELAIRVNGIGTQWHDDDITAAAAAGPDAVLVPKVDSAAEVLQLVAALEAAGAPETTKLWAMIETPVALLHAEEICAAHERLTHEALRAQHEAGGVRAQPLLLPAVVDLPPHDAARLLDRAGELAVLGLEIEGFGAGAVLVRALPAALGAPDPTPLLRDLADELAEAGEATALAARLDAVLARLACHGSIRAGRRLSQAEMDALLRRMEATPRAATCSHGRPTVLTLSRGDLERMFGRR